ncbi:MAG: hypothetical protein ACJ74O_03580 [Frankiaceae bacterium]
MSPRQARPALVAATVAATTLGLALTPVRPGLARAAGTDATPAVIAYLADDSMDGTYGLYWATIDGSVRHAVVRDNDIRDVGYPVLSPDGSRVAFEYDANGSGTYAIAVANLDGSGLRTLVPTPASTATSVGVPAWSPDGSRLVFTVATTSGDGVITSYRLRTVTTTGTATVADVPGGAGLAFGSYDPTGGGRIVAASAASGHQVVMLSGGTAVPVPGTSDASFPRLSRDGSRIAYQSGRPGSSSIVVTPLDGSTPTTVATGAAELPAWSLDGSTVYYDRPGPSGTYDLMSAPADGSAPASPIASRSTDASDELAPTVAPLDTTPPSAAGRLGVRLAGTRPALGWSMPAEPDVSHVVVQRGAGTDPTSWTRVYSGRGTAVTDTVTAGQVYTYSVTVIDGAGNASAPVQRTMRALPAPAVTAPAVVASASTSPSFKVDWGGKGSPSGTRYVVDVSTHRPTSTSAWTTLSDGTATSRTYSATTSAAGSTFHFRARTVDAYGNSSAPAYAASAEPYDDRAAQYAGTWRSANGQASRWLGTLRTTRAAGATAIFKVSGTRYYLYADRCPQCGSLRIYTNGHYRTTVSSYASTTQPRRLIWTSAAMPAAPRYVKVVNVGTSGHAQLHLDAVAGSL